MSVEHILLGVLSWMPNSGYGIKKEVEISGRELGWGRLSYGSIYPKLKKLEEEGFIRTVTAEREGRMTKIYELTAKGWRELGDWLRRPPAPPEIRDELVMKISFWETGLPEDRETLIEHLELRRREAEEMVRHLEEWSRNGYSAISELGGLSMDYWIDHLRLSIEWYGRMIRYLEGLPTPPRQDPHGLYEKARRRRQAALGLEESDSPEHP